jgi:hypothetical protein
MRLVIIIALLLISLAAGVYSISRLTDAAPAARVEADIADRHFSYKRAYARDPATATGGLADRLAFAASFPGFAPLPPANASLSSRALAERRQRTVLVTVSIADDDMDPIDRPARLYSRFLEGDAAPGPGGLVVRRFEPGSPYQLEELFLAPDGRSFFARCPKQEPSSDAALDLCLSVFRTKSLDVELRFAQSLLEHWETLIEEARRFIAAIETNKHAK